MKPEGLDLIKEYRAHRERYLPMRDHTEAVPQRDEYGDVNIGWNAGLLGPDRPYFVECWAAYGITMLTIFVSSKGIGGKTPDELTRWFLDTGYFSFADGGYQTAEIGRFTDSVGEEFFSVNIAAGVDGEAAKIRGARIFPWRILNDYNRANEEGARGGSPAGCNSEERT